MDNKRLQLMVAGAEDLEQWMLDAIRQGLAALDNQGEEWENISSRMVDAKARGLAQQLKDVATYREEDWPERLMEVFSQLYLSTQGLQHIDRLPSALKEQLLQEAGVNIKRKDLLEQEGINDDWLVLSRWRGLNIDKAAMQKTWLLGLDCQQIALLLDYDYTGEGFEHNFQIGQVLNSEVVYYPESFPVRAVLKKWSTSDKKETVLIPFKDIESFLREYARTLAINPWLSRFPCLLENMTPFYKEEKFFLIDQDEKVIRCKVKGPAGWTLLSISEGKAVTLFGEWDGKQFFPLSVFIEKRFMDLGAMVSDVSGAKRFRSF